VNEAESRTHLVCRRPRADSLDTVELVMALEENSRRRSDEEAEKITTVQQAIDT